ncbi:hypothetical protein HK102_002340 [Quaeritorhiza haematococci]|nr:hypothetical protein HK102_002340 [Quaeritorhiza haematococci]
MDKGTLQRGLYTPRFFKGMNFESTRREQLRNFRSIDKAVQNQYSTSFKVRNNRLYTEVHFPVLNSRSFTLGTQLPPDTSLSKPKSVAEASNCMEMLIRRYPGYADILSELKAEYTVKFKAKDDLGQLRKKVREATEYPGDDFILLQFEKRLNHALTRDYDATQKENERLKALVTTLSKAKV